MSFDRTTAKRGVKSLWRFAGSCGLALALVGCVDSRPSTLLTDLRYVGASVEPPDILPGRGAVVQFEIADPGFESSPRTLDYVLVICSRYVDFGDCLEVADLAAIPGALDEDGNITEEGYRAYFQHYVRTGQTGAGLLKMNITTPYPLSYLLTPNGEPGNPEGDPPSFTELPGTARLLTCTPDTCPDLLQEIADFQAGLSISETGQSLYNRVTTSSILENLAMGESALGLKDFVYSARQGDEINANPLFSNLEIECGSAAPSEGFAVRCTLDAILAENARQSYTTYDETGTASSNTEALEVEWYSTAGEPIGSGGGGPPGLGDEEVTPLPENFSQSFDLTETEAASPTSFYAVLKDNRKGQSWRQIEVVASP